MFLQNSKSIFPWRSWDVLGLNLRVYLQASKKTQKDSDGNHPTSHNTKQFQQAVYKTIKFPYEYALRLFYKPNLAMPDAIALHANITFWSW